MLDVLANLLWLVIMFIKDDFPTFDRPMKAYSGMFGSGHFFGSVLDITNSAELIFILTGLIY